MIFFSCPQCRANLRADYDKVGTQQVCAACNRSVEVPARSEGLDREPHPLRVVLIVAAILAYGYLTSFGLSCLGQNSCKLFQTISNRP